MKKFSILLILAFMACAKNTKTTRDAYSHDNLQETKVMDNGPDLAFDTDATDAANDTGTGDSELREVKLKPGESIPRPDPALFDCTAGDWNKVPARRSTVPLNCYIDPKCHQHMVIGHRAAGGQMGVIAPENTLAAVRAAIIMGLDGIEIDVRDTKDGHLVLMHDDTVDRTTDGHGKVSDLTLDRIRALHIKVNKGLAGDFSCLKVPTFEEVLAMAKGRLFIDIDTKTDRVDLVVKAVEDAGMLGYASMSAGGTDKTQRARALDPKMSIQVRPGTMKELKADLDEFNPDPQIVEVHINLVKDAAAVVGPLGLKLYTDVFFPADSQAYIKGNFTGYIKTYNDGCDIEASEFPSAVLKALGRWNVEQ